MPGKLDGFGNTTVGGGDMSSNYSSTSGAAEDLQVGDKFEMGGRTIKIATEADLEMFRRGENEGESLGELMRKLKNVHGDEYELTDEESLRRDLAKPENIARIMKGETRPEVYLVVRRSQPAEGKGEYTRLLLRKEDEHYKLINENFDHQDSDKLQPKDRVILAEGGPATVK